MKPRIGLFGGTFDPIHLGHVHFAREAVKALQLDQLVFVPAGQNPLKKDGPRASGADRIEMVRLAIEEAGEKNWLIYPDEALRPGPSFTIDTVVEIQKRYAGDWTLLMGSEVFESLPRWKSPELLVEKMRLALAIRPGEKVPPIAPVLSQIHMAMASDRVHVLALPTLPYSSTALRNALGALSAEQRSSLALPPAGLQRAVWRFIKEKQLYTVV